MCLTVQIMAWQETEALHSGPWISGQGRVSGGPFNLRDCKWLYVHFLRGSISIWPHVLQAEFILERAAVEDVKGLVIQLCPDSSIHGILQAGILEWVVMPFSGISSWPRDWTQVSCMAGRFFAVWATRETQEGRNQEKFCVGRTRLTVLPLFVRGCYKTTKH